MWPPLTVLWQNCLELSLFKPLILRTFGDFLSNSWSKVVSGRSNKHIHTRDINVIGEQLK